MTSVFSWIALRSNFGVGGIEFQQVGWHQDRVTHNVTFVHVPKVREASASTCRVISSGGFLKFAELKVGDSLHSASVFSFGGAGNPKGHQRQSTGGHLMPAKQSRVHVSPPQPFPEPGCTPGAINVSLICNTILGQWRETSCNVSRLLPCAWEETATSQSALLTTRSSQSNFPRRL